MGLFSRKSMQERQEQAYEMADRIAQGKGFTGRLTKMVMGAEFTESVNEAMSMTRSGATAQVLAQNGAPTRTAVVSAIGDTGQTVNEHPIVQLVLDDGGQQLPLRTLVSRLEIPRRGDRVLLVTNPETGETLYGGLSPA
jgi:hypothetical protein